ncbi:hypothetical protein F2Q68_00003130 [Brassica cretica]|uniref:Uncharacterized protein n=1 Tax=Brassica cretica TaxID=69181 RepID=A0A8S9JDD6_BRACR|nr:hypothetical protein F2Q68_00003130 [Brassica cretica]
MPPLTKRPPGRHMTKRFPSTGEMPGPKKKTVPKKCGRYYKEVLGELFFVRNPCNLKENWMFGIPIECRCSRGECFDLGFGVDDTFVVFVYLFWLQGGVMVGSNVTEAICVDVLFVVLVVMVWLNVVVGLGCGVRSVLVMVMDHVVVVGVLSNKRCRGCGVDVPMLCWGLVGA